MVVPLLADGIGRGVSNIPFVFTTVKSAIFIAIIYLLKKYFSGTTCKSERNLHGKVVMVTGGTSGIGSEVVKQLAIRGAQIILLTHHEITDPFLVDYIDDLRTTCGNELIYSEQVDLSSLHSIRLFATKWVDNAPPRRLDGIILCAAVMTPYYGKARVTIDSVEEEWMMNYLSSFHLLSILSPAIRAQPPDRDIRIIFTTCSSYIGASLDLNTTETITKSGSISHGRSKLALMNFFYAFQKHLDAYSRPDKQPNNARAVLVDPGYSRTPGMRRWLTGGSLIGLAFYMLTWPIWWLILKSPEQGAQSFLYAMMDPDCGVGAGGKFIKECNEIVPLRSEPKNEEIAKTLWQFSEKQVERLEKQGAIKRNADAKNAETGNIKETNGSTATSKTAAEKTDGSRRSRKQK